MFEKKLLDNGARVILVPRKDTETVTLLAGFGVGSRYEPAAINGVSHFIEHLMFKGTQKRPTTLDISKALDSVGAEYNAFTAKDNTWYYIKIAHSYLELALDIMSDMVTNSKFDAEEMEREKKVIVEEINMYEDNPAMFVDDVFESLLYDNSSLGWLISGTRESLTAIPRESCLEFKNRHYLADKMVVGLAGKLNNQAYDLASKYFGQCPKSVATYGVDIAKGKFEFPLFKVSPSGPQVKVRYKNTEQVQLALGFPAFSHFDPRIYPLALLAIIMGGNMSSRLFISVRERRGLAYHVRASMSNYQDTGNFAVFAGLDKSRLNDAITVILDELVQVRDHGVTEDELKRAQEFIKGKMTIELEDSSQVAIWFAQQELLKNQIITPEEKIKKFFAVTTEDIKKVAQEVITNQHLNLALIGPYQDSAPFKSLLKI